jgi:hypothetical protein
VGVTILDLKQITKQIHATSPNKQSSTKGANIINIDDEAIHALPKTAHHQQHKE